MTETTTPQSGTGLVAIGALALMALTLAGGYSYLIIEPVMMNIAVQIEREAGHALVSLSDAE